MQKLVTRTKASCIILGIMLTILGLAFFVNPVDATLFITLLVGWGFLIAGVVTFLGYFRAQDYQRSGADMVLAVLEFVLGLLIIIWPGAFALYLFILLGVVILCTGFFDIVEAFSMRPQVKQWWIWLILGIITVLLGISMFVTPFAFAEAVMIVAGVALVYDGITEIIVGIRL